MSVVCMYMYVLTLNIKSVTVTKVFHPKTSTQTVKVSLLGMQYNSVGASDVKSPKIFQYASFGQLTQIK